MRLIWFHTISGYCIENLQYISQSLLSSYGFKASNSRMANWYASSILHRIDYILLDNLIVFLSNLWLFIRNCSVLKCLHYAHTDFRGIFSMNVKSIFHNNNIENFVILHRIQIIIQLQTFFVAIGCGFHGPVHKFLVFVALCGWNFPRTIPLIRTFNGNSYSDCLHVRVEGDDLFVDNVRLLI